MEFCFEVNPDFDLAIGSELTVHTRVNEFYEDDTVVDDVNPLDATGAKPGSETKVQMLAARYAAGIPLWHGSDCYDHGPGGGALFDDEDSDHLNDVEEEVEA